MKPGPHRSCEDRKRTFMNTFSKLSRYGLVDVLIPSIDLSQEIFEIDILKALKPFLEHNRKHYLRLLQLYGDQALL